MVSKIIEKIPIKKATNDQREREREREWRGIKRNKSRVGKKTKPVL